mmetsp:Transcript_17446/g.27876  ORF Transcript_17446/g.27876 Transcript_17446/m.27876 type:complete len:307 (+) Transcript_17446:3-923(+)
MRSEHTQSTKPILLLLLLLVASSIAFHSQFAQMSVKKLSQRIAVVTGGNKGIGYEIIKKLAKAEGVKAILAARSNERGIEACKTLKKDGYEVEFHRMDLNDKKSIADFSSWIKEKHGGLDILVNNAAIAYKGSDPTPFQQQAEPTMKTNFYGTLDVCDALIPLMRKGGNIVNVASRSGTSALSNMSSKMQAEITDSKLTREGLCGLVDKFIADVKGKKHSQAGWSNSCYGTSKLAVIVLSRILAEQLREKDISVTSMCPGWCKTDMSSHSGPRTAEQGADTAAWLAVQTGEERPLGGFYGERKKIM